MVHSLGAVCDDVLAVRVHPLGDKTRWQAVPLVKGHAGAQRVGASSALLALLRLHVEVLPLTTGKGCEKRKEGEAKVSWGCEKHDKEQMEGKTCKQLHILTKLMVYKVKCKARTLTALSAFDRIWEACAYVGLVGNRHSPSWPECVTLCVLKVIIWLQGQNTGVSFSQFDISTLTEARQVHFYWHIKIQVSMRA